MAAEQLQIQVQANVQQAISGLNAFNNQLEATGKASESLGATSLQILNNQLLRLQRIASNPNLSPEQYQRLATLINKTSKEVDTLTKSINVLNRSNGQFIGGANQANTAMINLGRTVSDAPFGFIGIANNIGPLIENFVALRKEAGTSGGALRALGQSLIGPGGLIVGVQLAVAAIQFIQLGFSRWTGSSKKAKEETEKLNDSLSQIANNLAKENFEVSRLSELITRQNASRSEQIAAYKKLNEIAPEYFGKLKDEKSIIEQTANAYFLYQNTLLNTFRIKAQEEELLNLSKELLQIEKDLLTIENISNKNAVNNNSELLDSLQNLAREKKGLLKIPTATDRNRILLQNENGEILNQTALLARRGQLQLKYNSLLKNLPKIDPKELKLQTNNQTKQQTLQDKINELLSDYKNTLKSISYEQQITGINQANNKLQTNLDFLKRAADLVGFTGEAYKTINADTKAFTEAASTQKIVDVITAYQTALSELDIKQAITGQDQLNGKINAATDAIIKLKTLGVEATNEEFIKLQNTLNGLQAEVGLREIRKRTEEITKTWDRFQLQIDKLNFNQTKQPLDVLKSRIDLIGNAIQELKTKGLTDKDLGIQLLSIQFEQLGIQFEKLKEQKKLFDELQQTISGGLTNAFSGVFEAVLSGQDAFKALGDSIKKLALDLIRVIIQMTIVKAIANLIAPGSGAAVGAGAADMVVRGEKLRLATFIR